MAFMAAILPAIMAVGSSAASGAAGAGAAAGGAAGAGAAGAAAGGAAAAGAAGAAAAGGAGAAGVGAGAAGVAGAGAPGAAMPAAGSVAAKAPSMMDKMDAFMNRPSVKTAQNIGGNIFKGAGQSSPAPNEQAGAPVENPIAPSPSFPGGDSAMPQPLMPGAMDTPFGASSKRALSDTLSRNGG